MKEAVQYYQEQAQLMHQHPAYASIHAQGATALASQGFPTRKIETWKYSSPDGLLKQRFEPMHKPAIQITLPESSGILSLSLEDAWAQMPERMTQHFAQYPVQIEHGFHALNAALLQTGWVIIVPDHCQLSAPIRVSFPEKAPNQASYTHLWVLMGEGAVCEVSEEYTDTSGQVYLTSHITEVSLSKNASCTHVMVQCESQAAYHLSHVFAYQAQESTFNSHVVNMGGAWVRSDKTIYLQAPGAACLMNGLYALNDKQHMDHHTVVFHEAGACQSQQDYRGVVAGQAKAVFNGRVKVSKHAQRTQAKQQNKNLLLSAGASVDTEPQLEIYADDVLCTHGATVGELNAEALFYLASRGIPLPEATRLIVAGFMASNLTQMGQTALRLQLAEQLQQHIVRDTTHV